MAERSVEVTMTAAILYNRINNERGSVGVIVALIMFVVMGMLMMTWNTAQLSKEKMRLQNAVDAAALAHATWQARGMNAIQNLNEEKYLALDLAITLTNIGKVTEVAAQAAYTAAVAASVFPPASAALKVVAWGFRLVAYATACTGGYLASVVCKVLHVFQYIFEFTPIAGLINAENFAYYNGAFNLGGFSLKMPGGVSAIEMNLSAIPITWPLSNLVMLPVEHTKPGTKPWKKSTDESALFGTAPFAAGGGIFKTFNAGKPWDIESFRSKQDDKKNPVLPKPMMWLAWRLGTQVEMLPLEAITTEKLDSIQKMPIFAIAAGQCITGDIVDHVDNTKAIQRPIGFGTGATAKLVPVSEAVAGAGLSKISKVVNAIVFH